MNYQPLETRKNKEEKQPLLTRGDARELNAYPPADATVTLQTTDRVPVSTNAESVVIQSNVTGATLSSATPSLSKNVTASPPVAVKPFLSVTQDPSPAFSAVQYAGQTNQFDPPPSFVDHFGLLGAERLPPWSRMPEAKDRETILVHISFDELKRKLNLHSREEIIPKSRLASSDPNKQLSNILVEYNKDNPMPTYMVESKMFGERVEIGKFILVHRNNFPQLVASTNQPLRLEWNFWGKTEKVKEFKQNDLIVGGYGRYLINVPQGKIAKGWLGNKPVLLGEGPHVIKDQNFHLDEHESLVDATSNYIHHSVYHILRVPPRKYVKITLGNKPVILQSIAEEYIFDDQLFKLITKPVVAGQSPEYFEDTTSLYIEHDNIHIIYVPKGSLAKVWIGNTPYLLRSREQPYVIDNPYFRPATKEIVVEGRKQVVLDMFVDSTTPCIIHGSIKRIMTETGNVAVCTDNGQLVCKSPQAEPYEVDSETFKFIRFIDTTSRTKKFPSDEVKRQRKADGVNPETINYEPFQLADGCQVGVQLVVVYNIENPAETLKKLKYEDINSHIEDLVVADMNAALALR